MPSQFGYWTIRGWGQAPRLLLELVGEDYIDDRVDLVSANHLIGDHLIRLVGARGDTVRLFFFTSHGKNRSMSGRPVRRGHVLWSFLS